MEHNGIAIVYKEGKKSKVKYIRSYSYRKPNLCHWGCEIDPGDANISYTDNINDAFLWGKGYTMETAVKVFSKCIIAELGTATILPINSAMFQRYFKVKKLKKKCKNGAIVDTI